MAPGRKSSPAPVWPPPLPTDESEEERKQRIRDEAEAKERNDRIDKELNAEREWRKRPRAKILLLGQAESGKSTVLKNFQLQFAPKAFESDVDIWRPVVHLNLVRSVNFVLDFLATRFSALRDNGSINKQYITPELRKLCARLAPLRQVEDSLTVALTGSSANSPFSSSYNPAKSSGLSMPTGYGWKSSLLGRRNDSPNPSGSDTSEFGQAGRILAACGEDIDRLWNHSGVQELLKAADITLEEQPGFFLDQSVRVTDENYKPLPEDVLKARVTTVGPEEHVIQAENSGDPHAKEWVIYDVGGSRSQRAAWAQFFDDVNIIIFLAPMSGFNQVLAEDESVNRLTDSLRLWQTICSNKILANVEFVIFLNKLDILNSKLKAGIQFSQFVTSYVDKPNETKPVAKYLLDVFVSLHQQHSPRKRKLHPHLTCAVDTRATSTVINRVREVILVKILSQSNVI
ncbi:G-alpha-domain-containing protein [Coprinopsis marcescibilis]|uniref:G-alpha-domain-containing protein n=1 Tax=Coprinopsis marcescibilis TaxID=230819 RepID=A0A5C3KBD6_COPMA|nr:G-alpha-domain-containing protein [Coprinopsis marcescibilis]